MSDARAMVATERCRDLVANPQKMDLKSRGGLEPRDVLVRFNRAAAHTSSAFQVFVTMKLAMGGEVNGTPVGPFETHTALVAQGKTEAEALESFFNWMADDDAVSRFTSIVRQYELDELAKAELEKQREADRVHVQRAKEAQHTWLEKKFDWMGRKAGVIKPKIQS